MVASGTFKRRIAACLAVLACAAACAAQEGKKGEAAKPRPDLSGTWVLEEKRAGKSKPPAQGTTRLVVVHSEPEIKISHVREAGGRQSVWESVHYTDGRGESNRVSVQRDPYDPAVSEEGVASKTAWRGDVLVVRSRIGKLMGKSLANMELVSEWRLSPDGRTLTETSRFTNHGMPLRQPDASDLLVLRQGPREFRRVYRRAN